MLKRITILGYKIIIAALERKKEELIYILKYSTEVTSARHHLF